jgi:hypothetical protein
MTLLRSSLSLKLEDFQGCLEALTACIGNGITIRLPDRECTRVTKKAALWYLR